jgi:hypothetical protein
LGIKLQNLIDKALRCYVFECIWGADEEHNKSFLKKSSHHDLLKRSAEITKTAIITGNRNVWHSAERLLATGSNETKFISNVYLFGFLYGRAIALFQIFSKILKGRTSK